MAVKMTPAARDAYNDYMKNWREKNREHIREYNRTWRENNKDRIKQYNKENAEKLRQNRANYWERKAAERAAGDNESNS